MVEIGNAPDKIYLMATDPKYTFEAMEEDDSVAEFYQYEITEVMDNFVRYEYKGIKKGLQ